MEYCERVSSGDLVITVDIIGSDNCRSFSHRSPASNSRLSRASLVSCRPSEPFARRRVADRRRFVVPEIQPRVKNLRKFLIYFLDKMRGSCGKLWANRYFDALSHQATRSSINVKPMAYLASLLSYSDYLFSQLGIRSRRSAKARLALDRREEAPII